jgi:radical SAM superfamily enzyme YgiQ (UPF0313 family)
MKNPNILILNLPSPPGMDVDRDYSGGYGTANLVRRQEYGHSGDVLFLSFTPYLGTAIRRQGWGLQVIDAQASRWNLDETLGAVERLSPDFIVSLVSLPSMAGDLEVLHRVKQRLPRCTILAVGTVARTLSDELLKNCAVDFAIVANYPFYAPPIMDLVKACQANSPPSSRFITINQPGKTVAGSDKSSTPGLGDKARADSLDDLDLEVYSAFPLREYRTSFAGTRGESVNYFPVLSSAGCPYPCIYCPYPLGFGKVIAYKSPDKLVAEMEYLRDQFGIQAFLFRDQVFTANHRRVETLCDLILARGLDVQWLFETRVDLVSKDLLEKVRRAGCNRIHFGIETGDAEFLRRVGKPGVEQRQALEAFREAAALGIRTVAHVIVGLPGETREMLWNTYRFLGELDPDNASWNLATPYPGTKLFEEAERKNLILTRDWTKFNTNELVMRTEELSGPELVELLNTFSRKDTCRKVFRRMKRAVSSKRELDYIVRRSVNKVKHILKR